MKQLVWLGVLLCYATVVLGFEDLNGAVDLGEGLDNAQLMDEAQVAKKAAKSPNLVITHEDAMGLKVIDDYAKTNKKLQTTEKKLRAKLAAPPEAMKGMSYQAIPGFVYKFQGRTMKGKSKSACELVCNTYSACKSYSYSPKKRVCVWSMSHLKYNPDYQLFAKKSHPEGKPGELYSLLPGMIVQDKLTKPVKNISFEECRYSCTKDASCKTFSFSKTHKSCIKTGVPLHYDDDYTYYEKNEPLGAPEWKKENVKENARKEKLKQQWIHASTRISRAKIEKGVKAVKQLAEDRKKAVVAEKIEKGARKQANADSVKCKLAQGQKASALEENMKLLGLVAKKSSNAIKLKASSEKMRKLMASKKHYEARSKAKLHYKLAVTRTKEAKKKHIAYMGMEKKHKVKKKKMSEASTKACTLRDDAQVVFKKKEVKMKTTEATAKKAAKDKQESLAETSYKKAKAKDKAVSATERKAKKSLAKMKAAHEGSVKKEQTATTELQRKAYITQKQKAAENVKKSTVQVKKDFNLAMKAKEKTSKAKEVLLKKTEKEKKARLLVRARMKEAGVKNKRVELKKKAVIKREKELKAHKVAMRRKKTELLKKKMVEQKQKGQKKLKQVKADELKKKIALHKKEQSYKNVRNSKERARKAKNKRKRLLKRLSVKEIDKKNAVRQDKLKKNSLKEQSNKAAENHRKASIVMKRRKAAHLANKRKLERAGKRTRMATSERQKKQFTSKERTVKAETRLSREGMTKAQQQKREKAKSSGRSVSRKRKYNCIRLCARGRHVVAFRRKMNLSKELRAKSLKSRARANRRRRAVVMLQEGGEDTASSGWGRRRRARRAASRRRRARLTRAQKRLLAKKRRAIKRHEKARKRAKAVPIKMKFKKRGKAFSYKGCTCHE